MANLASPVIFFNASGFFSNFWIFVSSIAMDCAVPFGFKTDNIGLTAAYFEITHTHTQRLLSKPIINPPS